MVNVHRRHVAEYASFIVEPKKGSLLPKEGREPIYCYNPYMER